MSAEKQYPFTIKVHRIGEARDPIYVDHFTATRRVAENRLSDVWNDSTPPNGSRYRAALYDRNSKRVVMSIGGR